MKLQVLHGHDRGFVAVSPHAYFQRFVSTVLTAAAAMLLGLSAALPVHAAQAITWHVDVGHRTDDQAIQVNAIFVARFLPERKVVRVGDTLTWTNIDPATPHTVTFGPEPGGDSGGPLAAFAPAGIDRPGHATISASNQAVNSGFIGDDARTAR